MFLSENFFYNEISKREPIDSNESYKILYEAEIEWNKLSLKMIKLEHVAFINKDNILLNEGISDFGNKIKDFFSKLVEKIKAFITKVVANILQFISNFEKVKARFNVDFGNAAKADSDKLKLTYSKQLGGVIQIANNLKTLNVSEIGNSLQSADKLENFKKTLNDMTSKFSEFGTKEEKVINQQDYDIARKFLFDPSIRKDAIGKLKTLENEAKKIANEGIKAANKAKSDAASQSSNNNDSNGVKNEDAASNSLGADDVTRCKEALMEVQKTSFTISKVINSVTIDCVRIVKKVASARKGASSDSNENKEEDNKEEGNKEDKK